MGTGIPYSSFGGGNPTIVNTALTSRRPDLAVGVPGVIDGSTVAADGVVLRGTILVWSSSNNKYHTWVHGTDSALAKGTFLIAQDQIMVKAGVDQGFSGFREAFLLASDLLDANSANGVVSGDLTTAAGFYPINALPGGSTTEYRLAP
jgi:hypothetical protein